MPVGTRTRATRALTDASKASTYPTNAPSAPVIVKNPGKRTLTKAAQKSLLIDSRAAVEEAAARKRRKVEPKLNVKHANTTPSATAGPVLADETAHYRPSTLPVEPKFSVTAAMDHLIGFDPRFRGLFAAMKCRPFVEPFQAVDPFRTLATSIVGQQVRTMIDRVMACVVLISRSAGWPPKRSTTGSGVYSDSVPKMMRGSPRHPTWYRRMCWF